MEINKLIDHTYLKTSGTKEELDQLLKEAKQYNFKSVCVYPTNVKYCSEQLEKTEVLVCTVIGFPLGANTVETKVFETLNAVSNGADEIEMVINISELKKGNYEYIEDEINQVVKAAMGNTVKVIIEISYLTEKEIKLVSEVVSRTQAHFIKASTGFNTVEATKDAIKVMKDYAVGKEVKSSKVVKTKEELESLVAMGAKRIGTSYSVQIMKDEEGKGC